MCILFRQYLTNFISYAKLSDSRGVIKLHGWGEDLGLNCDAFDGTIIVHVLEDKDLMTWRGAQPRQSLARNAFEQASEWLQRCLRSHGDCHDTHVSMFPEAETELEAQKSALSQLPKRLIDLAHDKSVLVINCADFVASALTSIPELQEYCTLSYRWGNAFHECVLTKSLDLVLEVSAESMPKTFKDAMTTARRLGIRFLWIDALCIVQPAPGDEKEWTEEGARMGIIYANAICTIAATSASHADQGFLEAMGTHTYLAEPCIIREEPTEDYVSTKSVTLPMSALSFTHCVTESPLNSRGWVVQERALSKRILHFTEHGLFWECGSLKANAKDAPEGLSAPQDFPSCRSKETTLSVVRVRHTRHMCPVEWFHFVRYYSFSQFTNAGDRLLALSSVARAVKPFLGETEYLAGLWKHDLVRGLAWCCYHPDFKSRKEFDCIAPSWSWASVVGGISFAVNGMRDFRYDLVEIVEVTTKPALISNEFGSVSEGKLKVIGTLESRSFCLGKERNVSRDTFYKGDEVTWDEVQEQHNGGQDEEERQEESDVRNVSSIQRETESPPAQQSSLESRYETYTCLPIAWSKSSLSGFSSDIYIGALILDPVGETRISEQGVRESINGEYKRAGWVEYVFWSREYELERIRASSLDRLTGSGVRRWMNKDTKEIIIL